MRSPNAVRGNNRLTAVIEDTLIISPSRHFVNLLPMAVILCLLISFIGIHDIEIGVAAYARYPAVALLPDTVAA